LCYSSCCCTECRREYSADTNQAGGAKHPGAKKNPYRTRAWEAVKDRAGAEAVAAMGAALAKEIAKQAAKLAAKAGRK
jgi:hypothetical protein